MARTYASPSDLAGVPWNVTLASEEAESVLYRATLVIEGLTIAARYHVDATTGLPTSQTLKDAFRDAVCAQALWFEETGDISGAGSRYNSLSLGSFSASGSGSSSTKDGSGAAAARISPEAITILRTAGLLSWGPTQ